MWIRYSIYEFTHWFTIYSDDYDVIYDFRFDVIDVIQTVQCNVDLIKVATLRYIDTVYQKNIY